MGSQSGKGEGKFLLFFLIWVLGSAGIGSLRYISDAAWMHWIIVFLVVALGGFLLWLYNKID